MRVVPQGRTEAQSLEARSLEAQSLESRSLEARSLEAQSLESRSLEAQSLKAHSLRVQTLPLQARGSAAGVDRPLTVIHVGPSLVRGGAEQWLVDLLRFLDPKKVRILRTIATEADLADPNFTSDLPIPVEIGRAESVRRAARECDVLVSWGVSLNDWLKDCRPPLSVVLAHGDGPYTRDALIGSDQVIDHVIAVSQAAKDICGAELPTSVIHNGVDCSRLGRTRSREAVRASLGFQPGDFVMGTIGRYSPEKRLPALVEAAALLPSHFKLLLVGWGAQRTALLEQANARIPSRFALATGWSYLGDYYSAMDAFCMASESEGGPLVVIEAMHCGRPVVTTPVGFVPEIIKDRINGVLVDGSPMSFAAAVMQLARHPEWARGMAAEGKSYAEQNSHARRMALDYEELLQRLWREKFAT
jgi:glycosyltransferase involved in cell wall biosynthesis